MILTINQHLTCLLPEQLQCQILAKGRLLFFYLTLTLLCTGTWLQAQPGTVTFQLVPIQHGDIRLSVTSILQDKQGFMWFGTTNGLYKYDGYGFVQYENDPTNPKSLRDGFIRTIYESRNGIIWIGTNSGGLSSFDKSSETFRHYITGKSTSNPTGRNSVWAIHEDSKGSIWVGSRGGLSRLDPARDIISHYDTKLNSPFIRAISEDSSGNLWVGTNDGLCKLTFENDSTFDFRYFQHQVNNPNSISSDHVRTILHDRSNIIWIGTRMGLNRFDPITESFIRYLPQDGGNSVNEESLSCLYEDENGILWIGTAGGGVNKFTNKANPQKARFSYYSHDQQDPKSLGSDNIWMIYQDRSGMFWVGTELGLYKLIPTHSEIVSYKHQPNNEESLSDNTVMAIYQDDQETLWLGTDNGLNRLDESNMDLANPAFKKYLHDPGNPRSLSQNSISAIYESQSGFWIGTKGGGLNLFNPQTGESIVYKNTPGNPNSLSNDGIRCIYESQEGTLWIGTRKGLNRMDISTGRFTTFQSDPGNSQSLDNNTVMCIYEDHEGQMWIGTRKGLNKFDKAAGRFKAYNNSQTNQEVLSIYEDTKRTLWIGTSKGLMRLDKKNDMLLSYSNSSDLPFVGIKNILEDNQGHLWLNTDQGVIKYNPGSKVVNRYFFDNQSDNKIHQFGAFHKSAQGEFFLGGISGVKRFFPEEFRENDFIPPVVVTDFQIFNTSVKINDTTRKKPILTKNISFTDHIELSHTENLFSFEFTALNYLESEKNQYKFKMEGFHDNWITTTSDKRFATFTNLDPGNYVFRVIASNNEAKWNEEGTMLAVTINPSPWESKWAYLLYTIAGIGLIFIYLKGQQNKLKKKQFELQRERLLNERLQHADNLKDEFLANTSHELRTPLNGIIGIAESLFDSSDGQPTDSMKDDLSLLIASGKRLSSLVNSILDLSRLKTHDLDLELKSLDLQSLVNVVIRMTYPLIADKDLALINKVSPDAPPIYADENRMLQILNNLIGNATKFTESGEVTVSAKVQDQLMAISVADTGIGIPEDKIDLIFKAFEQVDPKTTRKFVGTGLGLSISKKLIELHGGDIQVQTKLGVGSVFSFTIPLSGKSPTPLTEKTQISKVHFRHHTQPEPEEYEEAGNNQMSILVVDDETINQKVLTNHLAKGNYRITSASNGEEALLVLEHMGKFDLVLLDVMMPKMSGFEVCQKIRERFSPAELPVIIITAKDQVSDLVTGFSCGANDFIAKPFSKDELLSRVKTHLELHKINAAYSKFVPVEFLKSLGRESILDVRLGDQVQQEITIFFSDIRSYSTISETMTPRENFNFLNSYLKRVSPLIIENQGFVNQYLGDGIMALFLKSATNALKASISIQKALKEYNDQRIKKGRVPIEMGIGLHTGPLIMGIIGNEERMDPTVVSDAVNTAARMEGLTKYYGASIIVSEDTLAKIEDPDKFNHRELGNVLVKGKKTALKIYEFYDGDSVEIQLLKKQSKVDFESGLNYFFNKHFTEAASAFEKVLKVYPEDKATQLYMKRSAEFMVKGVPENWSGIEAMDHK